MANFKDNLNEALKRKWTHIHESIMPSEGIWYIIYLKPKWVLKSYKDIDFPDCDHVRMWESDLSHVVADHYGASQKDLAMFPYSFPRGRIVNLNPSKSEITIPSDRHNSRWAVYYGKDLPGGDAKWKAKILSAFDLSSFIGRVEWKFDDHEIKLEEDVTAVSNILRTNIST